MRLHRRYFIYKIESNGKLHYREQTGCWIESYDKAQLWSNEEFVETKAKELKRSELEWQNRPSVCGIYTGPRLVSMNVGTVDILPYDFEWKKV